MIIPPISFKFFKTRNVINTFYLSVLLEFDIYQLSVKDREKRERGREKKEKVNERKKERERERARKRERERERESSR